MNIVHFAPFAPNGCGLYEAARDMIVADRIAGHYTLLVDTGVFIGGQHTPGESGKVDSRYGIPVETSDPAVAMDADLIIAHTGIPDPWIVGSQAPIIWMLHGRPQACFRPEQFGNGNSFSLLASVAKWPRVKSLVSFWPYHKPFWLPIIPETKLVVLDSPPIDPQRFSRSGNAWGFDGMGGKVNVVLADSLREDVDLYEVTNGIIEFCKGNSGVKFHFFGMENPLRCWEFLVQELRMLGGLGQIWARRTGMDEVYRGADLVLSPHKITTRVIGEALSCGTPVLAAHGCKHASLTCDPSDPFDVAKVLELAISKIKQDVDLMASGIEESFSLTTYNQHIQAVYEKVLSL